MENILKGDADHHARRRRIMFVSNRCRDYGGCVEFGRFRRFRPVLRLHGDDVHAGHAGVHDILCPDRGLLRPDRGLLCPDPDCRLLRAAGALRDVLCWADRCRLWRLLCEAWLEHVRCAKGLCGGAARPERIPAPSPRSDGRLPCCFSGQPLAIQPRPRCLSVQRRFFCSARFETASPVPASSGTLHFGIRMLTVCRRLLL